ncbi:MAG: hypothetical protein MJ149_01635, partial [Clostridia bacterium]|nr:hypothetical protein [Clostridia bacterium]
PDKKSQSVIWRKERFTTRWEEFCSSIFGTEIRGDWPKYIPYFIKDVKELKNEVVRGNVHCVKDTATKVSYSTIKKIQGEYGHNFEELRDEINENILYGNK